MEIVELNNGLHTETEDDISKSRDGETGEESSNLKRKHFSEDESDSSDSEVPKHDRLADAKKAKIEDLEKKMKELQKQLRKAKAPQKRRKLPLKHYCTVLESMLNVMREAHHYDQCHEVEGIDDQELPDVNQNNISKLFWENEGRLTGMNVWDTIPITRKEFKNDKLFGKGAEDDEEDYRRVVSWSEASGKGKFLEY